MNLLVVGAGPAGMAAAMVAHRYGLQVTVLDDQPSVGGQIWRSITLAGRNDDVLGPSYVEGRAVADAFRESGVAHVQGAQLWQIEPGFRAFFSRGGKSHMIEADAVLLATGAQERPMPFPGWTLPGVMTVGAAQILLKSSGQIPAGPVWIAGSGPLPLLYATQLLRAGGHLAGFLDTTPTGQWLQAIPHLPRALRASGDLLKGLGWQAELRRGTKVVKGVIEIEAVGSELLEKVRYKISSGRTSTIETNVLLIHEGVVPNIHPAMSLDCSIRWNASQECFEPVLDEWGESSRANLFIAGDGAGIGGAKAALLRGELAGLRVAAKLGGVSERDTKKAAAGIQRKLSRELAARPFLDAMFRPRVQITRPSDETIVCRCEEVTAGTVRTLAAIGQPGPNQVKAASRCGMGPCQGRQCGYSVTRIVAATQGRSPADVGYQRIRSPLKPVSLGELASLDRAAADVALENEHSDSE